MHPSMNESNFLCADMPKVVARRDFLSKNKIVKRREKEAASILSVPAPGIVPPAAVSALAVDIEPCSCDISEGFILHIHTFNPRTFD